MSASVPLGPSFRPRLLAQVVALVALAVLFALGRPAPALAAGESAAEVVATAEKGFGRLVITFKDRQLVPQFSTRLNSGVLVIQFAEAVSIDVDRLPNLLPQYVTIARRDTSGQSIRLGLARQVKVNAMEAGERLFVDLLPSTWSGPPPALPEAVVKELASRAEQALKAQREAEKQRFGVKVLPKLDFRVGRHPTFTRFSFGWNVPFDTAMAREKDTVTLTFNRLAEIDFAPVLADPPPTLREIAAEPDGDKLKIIMTIAPEADVRAFREEQTYVVDLSNGSGKPANAAEAALRKALDGGAASNARQVVTAPGVQPPEKTPLPEKTPAPEKAKAPEKSKPAGAPAQAAASRAEPMPAVPALPADPNVRTTEARLPPDGETAPAPVAPEAAKAEPAQAAAAEAAAEPPSGGESRPEVNTMRSSEIRMVRVEAKRIGNIVRVAFPFPTRVASAAFKRDENLWLVFDSVLPMDLRAITAVLGPLARDVTVNRTERGQTIKIHLSEPMLTTLGADGNSWILSIGEMVLEPARPLQVRREFRGQGQGMLKVDLADAGSVHEVNDPAAGDRIYVVTAFGPPRGLLKAYRFTELDTLQSAHGVAVVPRTDDVQVGLENGAVTMSRERGLTLSTGSLAVPSIEIPRAERRQPKRSVDASTFEVRNPGEFTARVRHLIEAVADAPDLQKNQARFDLAEFYIAHRFGPEALGVLRLMAHVEPGIERDPGFIILFGAAQTMTGRHDAARRALSRTEVADNPDALVWRTIAAVGDQRWDEARDAAEKVGGAVGAYPADVQALFTLGAAEASVELNQFAAAQSRLAEIEPNDISADLRARFDILQARIADAAGRPEDAMDRLDRVAASTDRRAAAEAEYRRLRMLVRDQKIEPAEAIDRLQSLAFDWRGDEIELKTLRFMATLQAKHGLYRDAFRAMRNAVSVAPEAATTRLLQDDMSREFVSLYLDDKADRMSPIEALTLYYDHRDMTPIGRLGDEIVRKLADRLVGVDLIDQASELLTYQVDHRLRGIAKAQIAADLAVLHLLDRKPDKALAVLNKTRQGQLPVSVERQRRVVEARALSDSGRADLALEMLAPLAGSDVDRLRADILWKGKRWREAGERLEAMLGGRWSEGPPLDDQERHDVLKSAVAYALANEPAAIGRLRSKFSDKMKASPNAATFDVVTAPIQSQGTEFRAIAREIAAVDTMRSFLEEYRTQYMKSPNKALERTPAPAEGKDAPKPAAPAGPAADAKPADGAKA